MTMKRQLPKDETFRQLLLDEGDFISRELDSKLGTSIWQAFDYTEVLRAPSIQAREDLCDALKDLLKVVRHPGNIEWLVRCLPRKQVFDGSFLEQECHRVEYSSTLNFWGDTIWCSKMTNVEGLIRKVLEDPEIEHRDKMFWILAAPGRLPKEEARKHVLDFIPIGPGVAAEAIRKIAEPEDLATFENLLESKLDPWDKKRIETTVKQLRKRFQKE